jgi:hypothetical protein
VVGGVHGSLTHWGAPLVPQLGVIPAKAGTQLTARASLADEVKALAAELGPSFRWDDSQWEGISVPPNRYRYDVASSGSGADWPGDLA